MTDDRKQGKLTYADSGVDYSAIDPVKLAAQRSASATAGRLGRWGFREASASRGESAYVWEEPDAYRALVVEGLGTKSLVADDVRRFTGRSHYDALAQDTVAMIVNDIAVVGAEPQVVVAYWAVGDSDWFLDTPRSEDLVRGWAASCNACGAAWGGGETPVLSDIVEPGTIDLGGACVGLISPKERLTLGDRLEAGDAIVLLASSGIHANGLTLARRIADSLADGYAADIGGITFGEALLVPTHLYPATVADILAAGIDVHYMANVTGHGWRKLMRAKRELAYFLHTVPPPGALFEFMVRRAELDDAEAYGILNMGAGFAVYCPAESAAGVVDIAARHGIDAWVAGEVREGAREVVIEPLRIAFGSGSLAVRA